MVKQVAENIYTFPISLPNNPLRLLNSYVIKGVNGGKNLLIDAGFNTARCRADLKNGMKALGLTPENTDVFFTHNHADHTGNAAALQAMGYRLIMGRIDFANIFFSTPTEHLERMEREGVPRAVTDVMRRRNAEDWMLSPRFTVEPVDDGDMLYYGGYELQCVLTPGHSPGHICLYDKREELIFSGDHVLFDITPNINVAPEGQDSLGSYMQSLKKVAKLPVKLALPGHRHMRGDFLSRVNELYEHHLRRLQEAENIIRACPGICAYDTAQRMTWSINADSWEDFPIDQKWYAFGETLSHLVLLEKQGRIRRIPAENGAAKYEAV